MTSVAQRYARATHSDDLSSHPDRRSDSDALSAAGWCRRLNPLGVMLYRLRAEWDVASGSYRMCDQHRRAAVLSLRKAERIKDADERERAMSAARDEIERAIASASAEYALALVHLKTLREARKALGSFALVTAGRMRARFDNARANELAGMALRLWLDERCSVCHGVGYLGGHLKQQTWCQACKTTGRSDEALRHASDEASRFQRALLAEMDRKCERVDMAMRRFLRNESRRADPGSDVILDLLDRLAAMRSREAETE